MKNLLKLFALVLALTAASLFAATGGVSSGDQDWTGQKTVDPNGTGQAARLGGIVYNSAAVSTTITNTTTETAFDTNYTLKANSLRAGDKIRIRYMGTTPTTNSTDTLTIKVYIGGIAGTALISGAAVDVANNNTFEGEVEITIRTIGASGTFVATSKYQDPGAAGSTAEKTAVTQSTAIDTTATQQVCVSATWSVASTSNIARLDIISVQVNP